MRSLHPIYNISVYGNGFEHEIMNHHNIQFTMAKGSPWHKFMESNGKIIYLGVELHANSMIHLPEYEMGLNYPRPVFFNLPHEFKIINYQRNIENIMGFVHAIGWKSKTVQLFMQYMHDKSPLLRIDNIYNTTITVVDSKKQTESLYRELKDNKSWYDAIAWQD